jgi:hypothetical protein
MMTSNGKNGTQISKEHDQQRQKLQTNIQALNKVKKKKKNWFLGTKTVAYF